MGRWRRLAVVAACMLLLAGVAGNPARASAQPAQASIVKGTPTPIATLPSLAYIAHFGAAELNECTGTVVAPRVVLTAGHCVQDLEHGGIQAPAGYAVVTGVEDLRKATRTDISEVARALIFPRFLGSLDYDAGLLILSQPVSAPPIPLAGLADGALLAAGTPLTIAGWGLTDGLARDGSPVLLSGRSTVQETGFCRGRTKAWGGRFSPQAQLCAIAPPRLAVGSCHGDSGGPAIAQRPDGSPVQVGIISSGEPLCKTVFPELLTRVDQVSSWVATWIAAVELGAPTPAIATPKLVLPRLSIPVAKQLATMALAREFQERFPRSSSPRLRCSRAGRTKAECEVSWLQGGDDYFGTVSTALVLIRPEGIFGAFRFEINRASHRCWSDPARPSCPVRAFTGDGLL